MLEELFAKILRVPREAVTDEASTKTLRKWNSFNHVRLVVAMEKEYNITFTSAEIPSFDTVAKAKEILRSKGIQL